MLIVMAIQCATILILSGLVIWIARKWRASVLYCRQLEKQLDTEVKLNGDLFRDCMSLLMTEMNRIVNDLKAAPKPPPSKWLS